jgi:putative DNA primase/helicase
MADLHDPDDDGPWVPPKITPLDVTDRRGKVINIEMDLPAQPSTEEMEEKLKELAALSDVEYENQRHAVRARWGMRLSVLDKLVERERVKLRAADEALGLDRQPCLEAVSGLELINDLVTDLTRYVSLDPDYAITTAFWVIHTYLLDCGFITPRLAITAPEKRCGKTTLLHWLRTTVQRPKNTDNISAAAVYHVVEDQHPTLLIDEADTFLGNNNELRGILNSGHQQDGTVDRWDQRSKSIISFSTYSACAISLIGNLPSTLQDRSIRIRLRRRRPDEKVASLRLGTVSELAGQCARWALDNNPYLGDPPIPAELFNRVEDNWRPLLAIADVIGGPWPERLRAIAVRIAELEAGEDPSQGTQLLHDIKEILGSRAWITSSLLIGRLNTKTWAMNGKRLAGMLKPYGIEPTQQRHGGEPERGYLAVDFADAFARYLTVPDVPDVPAPTPPPAKTSPPDVSEGRAAAGTSGTSGTRLFRRI